MNHSNPPTQRQRATAQRPACVPRPTQHQAGTPIPKPTAQLPARPASNIPKPPPSPMRPSAKPRRASPPPLPETILLTDADLVDDDLRRSVRASQPTSVDVEIDCFTRSEPPPESRPRRKHAWLALVTGLLLVAAGGSWVVGRPLALQAFTPPADADAVQAGGTRASARSTVAALSEPLVRAVVQPSPATAPNIATKKEAPGPKLSVQAKHRKAAVVSGKKLTKPLRTQRVLRDAT